MNKMINLPTHKTIIMEYKTINKMIIKNLSENNKKKKSYL